MRMTRKLSEGCATRVRGGEELPVAVRIRYPISSERLYTSRADRDKAEGDANREVAAASGAGRCVKKVLVP